MYESWIEALKVKVNTLEAANLKLQGDIDRMDRYIKGMEEKLKKLEAHRH